MSKRITEDTALLDWWEKHPNIENSTDFETGEVVLYKLTGNINDRVFEEVGRGETLRAAIRAARRSKSRRNK